MNGKKRVLFGGIIASRLRAAAGIRVHDDDYELPVARLDYNTMKSHQFITHESAFDNMVYKLLFNVTTVGYCPIPAPLLFNRAARGGWSFPMSDLEAYLAPLGYHPQNTAPPQQAAAPEEPQQEGHPEGGYEDDYEEGSPVQHQYQDEGASSSQQYDPPRASNAVWDPWMHAGWGPN